MLLRSKIIFAWRPGFPSAHVQMPALTTGSGEAELLPEPSSETWEAAQVSRLTLSPDVSFVGVPVGAGPDGGCWPLGQCWAWMCPTRKKRDVNQSSLPLSTPPSLRLHLPPSGPALTIPLQNHPCHLGSGPRASRDRDPVPKEGSICPAHAATSLASQAPTAELPVMGWMERVPPLVLRKRCFRVCLFF